MKRIVLGMAIAALMATPSLADVKKGVDAWAKGDYAGAIKEWRPLAISGDADAQFNLGQAYKLGRGVSVDLLQAEDWYRKAALQGHLQAEDNYGLVMFQNGNRQKAMPWIEKSANRGEPRAQYILGTALFNGDMVGKDWIRAYALMTRASASGLAPASASLAQMDKYIPVDQRQQGLAMARSMESAAARPMPAPVAVRPVPSTGPVARPVAVPPYQPPAPEVVAEEAAAAAANVDPAPRPRPVAARPAPKPPAPVATAPSGRYRVQLGAFSQQGNANAQWSSLSGRVSALSGLQPFYVRAGTIIRLQAGPLASSAAAEKLCAAVRAKGGSCLPVAP